VNGVRFAIASHAAWAPGITAPGQWCAWARAPFDIGGSAEPALRQMPPMLRRRAGSLGKMALEVVYECMQGRADVPTVFCSRHGEVARAIDLLTDLVGDVPVSPTGFGLAVHNASAGLFSIARGDRANHIALAAGASTVEHAVIEACGLLADGAPEVLLVAYDCPLPLVLAQFEDCAEQAHAWAWLMVPAPAKVGQYAGRHAGQDTIGLHWSSATQAGAPYAAAPHPEALPGGLEVLRFYLSGEQRMERVAGTQRWTWTRDA
jgi:hypothetical protein